MIKLKTMHLELIIFLFVILGLVSGILGGLIGIGGGVVTVPILYYIFQYTGMLEDRIMQVAVSTSLASGFITSAVSTIFQMKKRAVLFAVVKMIVPGLVIGCIAGSVIAHYLPSFYLREIFGVVAFLLGIYFFFPKLPPLHISRSPNNSLSLFGLAIGCLSSMLGIGGGSLTFPILLGYQVPVKNSSATSSASTLVTTFVGTLTYLFIAWNKPELPETFGYVEIPAFIAVSIGAIVTTPYGVKLSHVLDVKLIKQIFGCSLSVIGITMLFL